jgi:6-pyruvoyltetrahydropterin/6-carboxytetrahydropterin synthase
LLGSHRRLRGDEQDGCHDGAGLAPPTLENLCLFIAERLRKDFGTRLARVKVWREALGDSCTLEL